MDDEAILRVKAHEAIRTGRLPARRPDRTWSGAGVGFPARCATGSSGATTARSRYSLSTTAACPDWIRFTSTSAASPRGNSSEGRRRGSRIRAMRSPSCVGRSGAPWAPRDDRPRSISFRVRVAPRVAPWTCKRPATGCARTAATAPASRWAASWPAPRGSGVTTAVRAAPRISSSSLPHRRWSQRRGARRRAPERQSSQADSVITAASQLRTHVGLLAEEKLPRFGGR